MLNMRAIEIESMILPSELQSQQANEMADCEYVLEK